MGCQHGLGNATFQVVGIDPLLVVPPDDPRPIDLGIGLVTGGIVNHKFLLRGQIITVNIPILRPAPIISPDDRLGGEMGARQLMLTNRNRKEATTSNL